MMINLSKSLTFTVPINSQAHALAQQFRLNHSNPNIAKQVYLNTLAVYCVKFYLDCMEIKTAWEASNSWNPMMQALMNVADIEIPNLGKLECRPVLPQDKIINIPPEVWSDRIGYVAVQFDESLRNATLLGFIKTAPESGELPLNELQSLEEMLLHLKPYTEVVKQPIQLSQWLNNIASTGWLALESLVSLLEPQQTELAFRFRGISNQQTKALNLPNSSFAVEQGKVLDLGGQSQKLQVALVVGLLPTEEEVDIWVEVHPLSGEKYLPEELQLMVLDETGSAVMQANAKSTKNIKLKFAGSPGEIFSVKVARGDVSFREVFLV